MSDWKLRQYFIVMVFLHYKWVIIEYCSICDVGNSCKVLDNVLEHVMGASHLDQVLCLLWVNCLPFPQVWKLKSLKSKNNLNIHFIFPIVVVTVGKPRLRLIDFKTSLWIPPYVKSRTTSGGFSLSIILSRVPHTY